MRTRFIIWCVAGVALFASTPSHSQDVQTILSKVAGVYKSAKSYQAQVTVKQSFQTGTQKQEFTTNVTTRFKAPNKMVNIIEGDDRMQVYSDGTTMYVYSPRNNEYTKSPAPASLARAGGGIGSSDPSQMAEGLKELFSTNAKRLPDRNLEGKPAFVIQSTQTGKSPDGKSTYRMTATVLIDKTSYLVRQIVNENHEDTGTQKMLHSLTITYVSQQINPNLPDSVFVFQPPAGARERQK